VSDREIGNVANHEGARATGAGAPAPGLAVRDLRCAIGLMRERGLRVSAARRLVVPSSDIASVYRNLQAFEDIGLVRHVHLGHGPGLHALAVTGEREYLTCERCADYREVQPRELDAVRALIAEHFGYVASFTHFPIVGLCASCAAAIR
jgi:Fur family ferric uptake transcriptional regulator